MNLLGCFKVVPDLELLKENDWVADSSNQVDTSFVKTCWNCFDESALELMLKLSDLSEGFDLLCRLHALTIGGEAGDSYLKTLYALGYEHNIRIECNEDLRFYPELTAGLIAAYVSQKEIYDMIVMGNESSDGGNGKTPLLTAEKLGWKCITNVTRLEPVDEAHIRVTSLTDEGTLTQITPIPCVLSVGNAEDSYLRVPTLKDRMKKGKKPIELLQAEELLGSALDSGQEVPVKLTELKSVDQSRAGKVIEGTSAKEKALVLYQEYLKERLEQL